MESTLPQQDIIVPTRVRRSRLWGLKTRLQHTGWLQYLIPSVVSALMLTLAAITWALGLSWIACPAGLLGFVLASVVAFDLLTVKAGLHPTEALPRPLDLDAFELMRARRSCRSFQKRRLRQEDRLALLMCATERARDTIGAAPIRFEYVDAPIKVWPTVGAQEFLVAIAPKAYDRGAVLDVGRSLQHVVLHATRLGLATCWIGPGADPSSVAAHLGERFDPERDHIICVCAIGYRSRYKPVMLRLIQKIQRRRLPIHELFAIKADTTPLDPTQAPFAAYGRCFEVCQWAPSSFNSQTTRCLAILEGSELTSWEFQCSTASRYYAPVALGIWAAQWELGCQTLGLGGTWELNEDAAQAPGQPYLRWICEGTKGA